jgi:hypothetical protein
MCRPGVTSILLSSTQLLLFPAFCKREGEDRGHTSPLPTAAADSPPLPLNPVCCPVALAHPKYTLVVICICVGTNSGVSPPLCFLSSSCAHHAVTISNTSNASYPTRCGASPLPSMRRISPSRPRF